MSDGVRDFGNGCLCYLQDCNQGSGWGYSNSGLVVDGAEALLIDTLRDERLTHKMLQDYRKATGLAARDIGTLVNTHRDGDHTFGNRLMEHERHNTVRSRNARLAALRAFLKFAAHRDISSLHVIERALGVPMKRFERPMFKFLSREHMLAVIGQPVLRNYSMPQPTRPS